MTRRLPTARPLLPRAALALTLALALAACNNGVGGQSLSNNNPSPDSTGWTKAAALPAATSEGAAIALGTDVYLITHANETLRYSNGSWSKIGAAPAANLDHSGLAVVSGKLFAVGGLTGWPGPATGKLWVLENDTWRDTGLNLNTARGAHATAAVGSRIYVFGGIVANVSGSYTDTASAEFIDLAASNPHWQQLSPGLAVARDHLTAQAVGDRIYVIGGRAAPAGEISSNFNAVKGSVEVFDAASGAKLPDAASLPLPRGGMGSAVAAGKIVVFGGEGDVPGSLQGSKVFDLTQVYDPASNTWSTVASLPVGRHGIASASGSDGAHAIGGGTAMGGGHDTNEHDILNLK